jgi:uncharacterized protein YcbK (DUF882 family)
MSSTRRGFLAKGVLTALSAGLAADALAWPRSRAGSRRLAFFNTHTKESLDTVYWADGRYVEDGLKAINHILRDHRSGDEAAMDLRLLDLLFDLRAGLDTKEPFHIISGYRSPTSNEYLRNRSADSGVAKSSQHLQARAADIRVPGRPLRVVREAAVALRRGGVGFYPASDFVHVDVARVRFW